MTFDSFEDIQAAWEEAELKRTQGDFLGAYEIYCEILFEIISNPYLLDKSRAVVLIVILATAELTLLIGDFARADRLFEDLVGLCQQYSNWQLAYFITLKRIQLALDRGLLHLADDLLHSLSPQIGDIYTIEISPSGLEKWETSCLWEGADKNDQGVLFSHLYLAMGRLLLALGQYSDALVTFNRGLFYTHEKASSLTHQMALPIRFSIAAAHLEKGELETAQTDLSYLKTQFDENQHLEALVRWLELSGKINLLHGQLGQALEKFEKVQQICQKLKLRRAIIQSTLNLAHVLITLNQTSLARGYLLDALADAKILQNQELIRLTKLLLSLVDVRGQSLATETPFGESVTQMRREPDNTTPILEDDNEEDFCVTYQSSNYLTLFDNRVLQIYWLLSRFELDSACQRLTDLKQAFHSSDSKLIQVKIKILEGVLAYYSGVNYQNKEQIHWAALTLDEICIPLKELNLKSELWQVKRFLGWCFARLNYPPLIREKLSQETQKLLSELIESLPSQDQAIYLLNKWTADEEYIAAQINQLQRRQTKLIEGSFLLRPWRRWFLIQHLHHLIEHIDRYKDALVKRTINEQNIKVNDAPFSSLWQRLIAHPSKRVTLSFLLLPDRVFVVRTWRFFFDFAVIPTTRLEVRNIIQSWHERIRGINGSRDLSTLPDENSYESVMAAVANESKDIANYLAKILEIPSLLQDIPNDTEALTIVPDDILHGFPFATIVHRGKYLIEHYSLSIVYESKSQKSPKLISEQANKALIVGVSKGTKQFAPLPEVTREVRQVSYWLASHNIDLCTLLDNGANKASVLDGLSKTTLLHIACHGTFEHNRPDQSGLVLISNSGQKEILSLRELSNLDLTRLRHVTLSSCWSADHFILPGRWIISLPETLWRSGTQSILGCLWEVYDKVAVSFMKRFYEYLDKLPMDEALRRTQLECLNGCLPECDSIDNFVKKNISNPIFWAGFNLYGDYRMLDLISTL